MRSLENLLNDLCGGFFQVVCVKDFDQRHPSHFGIFVQADIQCRWSEVGPARHYESEQQQQHRSRQHHDPLSTSPWRPHAGTGNHTCTTVARRTRVKHPLRLFQNKSCSKTCSTWRRTTRRQKKTEFTELKLQK